MTDLYLNPTSHDIEIVNGDIMLVESVTRASVRQEIKQALLLFSGEWYLNTLRGVRYFEVFFVKNPDRTQVEGEFKDAILGVNNVVEFTRFTLDYNNEKRLLNFDFAVKIVTGEIVEFNELVLV